MRRITVRYAHWEPTRVHMVDPQNGKEICQLFPENRVYNSNGERRVIHTDTASISNPTEIKNEVAPLFIEIATIADLEKSEANEKAIVSALKALSQISTPEAHSALKKASLTGPTQLIRDEAKKFLQ